jgi:hypothetical protein
MALAGHSGSCDHGCGDQHRGHKFKLRHLIYPLHMKSPRRLLHGNGAAIDGFKLQLHHVVRRVRSGASYDHSPMGARLRYARLMAVTLLSG